MKSQVRNEMINMANMVNFGGKNKFMRLKEGAVVEVRVTGISKYGAFVKTDDNINGMIHISEISSDFVRDVSEYLEINQVVKAVVVAVNENGKISLSIKKLNRTDIQQGQDKMQIDKISGVSPVKSKSPEEYTKYRSTAKSTNSFEDMMSKFKQDSDEKMSGMKNLEPKKNSFARRKSYQGNKDE